LGTVETGSLTGDRRGPSPLLPAPSRWRPSRGLCGEVYHNSSAGARAFPAEARDANHGTVSGGPAAAVFYRLRPVRGLGSSGASLEKPPPFSSTRGAQSAYLGVRPMMEEEPRSMSRGSSEAMTSDSVSKARHLLGLSNGLIVLGVGGR
jgi:hypothetical protein